MVTPQVDSPPTTADPALARIEADIEQRVARAHISGLAFGIVRDGGLAWSRGFGFADIASGAAPDASTLFRVGSITKTFTATALVQLRDAGRLRLDDPLAQHIPEFAAVRNPYGPIEDLTLRRLLSHHSGLAGEPPMMHWKTLEFPSMAEIVAALPRTTVAIPPDCAFKYSNLAFALLGEVVARVSGRPYEQYVQEEILAPLGMTSSVFALTDALRVRMATGYQAHPYDDCPDEAPHPIIGGETAAGQLYSTVEDLARWVALQLTAAPRGSDDRDDAPSPVLSRASLFEMQRPIYLEPDWSMGYGVAWMSQRKGDKVYTGHGGGIHGFTTQILFNVPGQVGVIALTNGASPPSQIALDVLDTLLSPELAAQRPSAAGRPIATPAQWRRFLGLYGSATLGGSVRIECRGGVLQLRAIVPSGFPSPPPEPLQPTDEEHVFIVRGGRFAGEPLTFHLAADGSVTGFTASGFPSQRLVAAEPD